MSRVENSPRRKAARGTVLPSEVGAISIVISAQFSFFSIAVIIWAIHSSSTIHLYFEVEVFSF
jgi:hypothetical protein